MSKTNVSREAIISHSPQFDDFNRRYELNFITKETLQGWVKINSKVASKGITAEEYKTITGEICPTV